MTRKAATVLCICLLAACAQVREPEGGAKDITAPILLSADPPDRTVRFTGDRIVLRFNERVKLDRIRERLLVSPPLDHVPDVLVSGGRDVVITLKAPLRANTTYTFNIGEAVVDLTEGNAASGLSYVMSTGDVLDSLRVTGSVSDAFTAEPEASVLVVLHEDTDPLGFTAGRPAYFTRTDKAGHFELRHLRGGHYRLHALRDQNANYRYDLPNEDIAFIDDVIDPRDSLPQALRMFREPAPTQQVIEAIVQPDRGCRAVLARYEERLDLRALDRTGGSLTWWPEWNATRDTVLLWPSDTTLLADQHFAVSDSSGVIDTLTYRVLRKMPFYVDAKSGGISASGDQLLIATRPIARIHPERITLRSDSMTLPFDLVIDTLMPRKLLLRAKLPEGHSAALELLPGAIQDIYGSGNDTLRIALGAQAAAQVGDLKVDLSVDSSTVVQGPFILQLINAQGGVVFSDRFTSLPHRFERPGTTAGVYTLKLIADNNDDGRWSTGSLRAHRQPERVFRQADQVNVRAGWEVVVDWVVKDR